MHKYHLCLPLLLMAAVNMVAQNEVVLNGQVLRSDCRRMALWH